MGIFSRGAAVPPPPLDLPYDPTSLEGLAARWMRWVAGIGPMHNPISDTTGDDAAIDQPGDVWFLAGTFGGAATRRVTVPAGVPILLPAFNMWQFPTADPPEPVPGAFGRVELDATPVETVLVSTPVPFLVQGARLNPVTRTRKPLPAVVTGWWALIDPLAPGEHLLHATGGDGGGFEVDVTVHLTVAP